MDLYQPTGVVLGTFEGQVLRSNGEAQVLLVGPQRSGKGTQVIIPTLYDYPSSVVVFDLRLQSYEDSYRHREGFSKVMVFNPVDTGWSRYNILKAIRRDMNMVRDCQAVSRMITNPSGDLPGRTERDHWKISSQTLIEGVTAFSLLHVLTHEDDKTLAGVVRFLSDPSHSMADTICLMLEGIDAEHRTDPYLESIAGELYKKSKDEMAGIVSTALSYLAVFRDPLLADATSECDFLPEDLRDPDMPMSLYIHIPPGDIERLSSVFRIMLFQILSRLTEAFDPVAREVLFIPDEFPAWGRMSFLDKGFAFYLGYGLRILAPCQGLNQIEQTYGPNNNIMSSCHHTLVFTPNDKLTKREVSEYLDKQTVETTSYTKRREIAELFHDQRYRNVSYTSRALMTPAEVGLLPEDDAILLTKGARPVILKKITAKDGYPHFRKQPTRIGQVSA